VDVSVTTLHYTLEALSSTITLDSKLLSLNPKTFTVKPKP